MTNKQLNMTNKQLYLLAGGILAATAVIYFIRKKKSNQEVVYADLPEKSNVGARERAQMLKESLQNSGIDLERQDIKIANQQTYKDWFNKMNQ